MRKIISVIIALCLVCLFIGAVSADDNVNEEIPLEEEIVYLVEINGEEFENIEDIPSEYADYESWHKTEMSSTWYDSFVNFDNQPVVTRQQVANLLLDESKSEEQRHEEEKELMGYSDKLQRFMDATKMRVGDVWYVKFEDDGNFITNLFGYNYQDYYEGMLAIQQYHANLQNWLGVYSRDLLHLEGY